MSDPRFVHLRFHSEYSITDGIVRIDPMIHAIADGGGVAVGICDLMNIFGGLRFYTHALAAGIKPILGCDLKILNRKDLKKPYRLGVLCMNHEGYHSLCVLLTKAFLSDNDAERGFVDPAWFADGGTEGLIALSGAAQGEIGQLLLANRLGLAEEALAQALADFPGRFYIELQRAGRRNDELATARLANLAAEHGVPVVATHPIQFLNKEDFDAHDVRCSIADGYTLSDPRRPSKDFYTREQYLKSEEEMCELFADIPAALVNSVEIAKRCNIDGVLSKPQLPLFPTPDGMSLDDYIDKLSKEGLQRRLEFLYPDPKVLEEKRPAYDKRLEYELGIIKGMKFPGYFLIVQDFINWSKRNGVPVGPGRGSGAGSLVAYSLGITDLDPLHFDLLFERFLNPERVSMPDFDVDFCQYNRDRTIDYVKRTYGVDAVSQIATFGTLGAKAVVRDVGRALDVPYMKTDALAKLIPMQPGRNISLDEAIAEVPELKDAIEHDDDYQNIIRIAKPLEGLTRNLGMHAGGVLIAPGKLTDFCPLYNSDGRPENTISQYDKKDVENVGLVKFDFLGLTTLSILAKAVEFIDKLYPEQKFELERIPVDDVETYELFQQGNTAAVFQFESEGMRGLLKQAKPDRLEDLVALNALYRPGPMDLIPSYIDRKFGREKVEYLDDRMEPVLKETYGIMVYQEQVMRVAQVVGGYSLGGADLLRRAMGKKNVEEMKRQRAVFVKGAAERGVKESVATEIFDLMEKFAGYGFNKSHAAAYSYVAYQTAYLKVHYTASFYAANLCMVMDDGDKMNALITDAMNNGVEFLIADVNRSDWFFSVPSESMIRFGLGSIKGINRSVVESLLRARRQNGPFTDIFDFARRVPEINQKLFESLIKAGAFDSIDPHRGLLLANVPDALQYSRNQQEHLGQDALFGEEVEKPVMIQPPVDWSPMKALDEERSVYGFWVSGHPYEVIKRLVPSLRKKRLLDLVPSKSTEVISGLVTEVRQVTGKKGVFGILKIDDGTSQVDALCYSGVWEGMKQKAKSGAFLALTGKIKFDDYTKQLSIIVDECADFSEYIRSRQLALSIHVDEKADIGNLKALLNRTSGEGVAARVCYSNRRKRYCGSVNIGNCSSRFEDLLALESSYCVELG
ncbi:DNA polymerase III subunit alpha [Sutterella sp.]|uniref:DNA polymerase III subunit alpha n=1 Tax=Sutterella sp. TaxID=1981025 RepID=UPI0026E10CF0|nr:DNA polymerase III subunit alpha [Sutterella sp.]MDO5531925.1 DNA polymerase III subunit alpha [Sutterella sp.]